MIDEAQLKKVMGTTLRVSPESITDESSMDTIEKWDSLRHLKLVLALEEEFDVMIPEEEATEITSYKLIKVVLSELVTS